MPVAFATVKLVESRSPLPEVANNVVLVARERENAVFTTRGESPAGAGIAGSSALTIAGTPQHSAS